ncbi:unnamed protein product, partial [Aphanomyces euteiches]
RPPGAKNGRVHPCSADEFQNLDDMVEMTEPGNASERQMLTNEGLKPQLGVGKSYKLHASDAEPGDTSMTPPEKAEVAAGLVYLIVTLVLSLYYLSLLSPSMSNDLWWAQFNSSGAQSYLIDTFNAQLNLGVNGSLDLTSTIYGVPKDYSQFYTPIALSPLYPRMIIEAKSTNLAEMMAVIKAFPSSERIVTQCCWIDWKRRWEVAHTDGRQKRCYQRYTDNAVVYWETSLRMIDWNTYMAGAYGIPFNTTMGMPFQNGFTRCQLQITNGYTWGVAETFMIRNAFGATQTISTKRMAYQSRGGQWTTLAMFWGHWNDFTYANTKGYSYVRSGPANQHFTAPCNYSNYVANPAAYACVLCDPAWNPKPSTCKPDFEIFLTLPNTTSFQIVHQNFGPLNSIDMYYTLQPTSLVHLYTQFQSIVAQRIQTDAAFATAVFAIPSLPTDPVPPSWIQPAYMYMGGDPTCTGRQPTSYVQSSFSFFVSCTSLERQQILLTQFNTLFALWVTSLASVSTACNVCPTQKSSCDAVMGPALVAAKMLAQSNPPPTSLIQAAYNDIAALGVSYIQMAINAMDKSTRFLRQLALGGDAVAQWDLFGWIYVYEWAESSREVNSFEGDVNIIRLISNKYSPVIMQAQPLEVPKSACQYLWVISVVVSTVLVIVGALISFYSLLLRGRIVGRNLFKFNRVVGAVWLGRPLLVVRGMTAIILLSTSPISFQSQNGYSQFQFTPRTFFQSMLVAGEATWIIYVLNDFFTSFKSQCATHFAPISTWIGWIIMVIIDASSPFLMTMTLTPQCTVDLVGKKLVCTSGEVDIGSVNRATTLVFIQVICVVLVFVANKIWTSLRPTTSALLNGHLLISGTASAFVHKSALTNGSWILDRAACAMCGLITFSKSIFDIKLWVLVSDAETRKPGIKWDMKVFESPDLNRPLRESTSEKHSREKSANHADKPVKPVSRVVSLIGLVYMSSTIFGSITYLTLTTTNMANDFWWANYNATREHAYMGRLYNTQLLIRPQAGSVTVTDTKFMDDANYTTSLPTAVAVNMKPLYASQIMGTDALDMATTIHGLRVMDACLAPWIATQYCWLDFGKKWEMANTAIRQIRCGTNFSTNAAVYLESVLRNVQWPRLRSCWGTSIDTALGNPLNRLPNGPAWWSAVQSVTTSEADELAYWQSSGVTSFATDWQNYKTIGIIDSFGIQNAFGLTYSQSRRADNTTNYMYGAGLIRQDAQFAFSNLSMESVLIQNGTIAQSDLTSGGAYSVFRRIFGPFGSVDLKRVQVPKSVLDFSLQFQDTLAQLRVGSYDFSNGILNLPTITTLEYVYGNVTTNTTNAICATTALTLAQFTSKLLLPSMNFLSNTSIVTDPTLLPSLREKALVAQKDMLDIGVHLIQYGLRNSDGNITFLKYNIFDPRYPVFHYNAWYFTMDWAAANREVLSFQGDKSSLNVLTSPLYDVASLVNPLESPVNVAFYIRYACFYVTMIIICVAVHPSTFS